MSREIGWSTESNLLWSVLQEIKRLKGIIYNSAGGGSVSSVTGTLVTGTPTNPIIDIPTFQQITDGGASITNPIVSSNGIQGSEVTATNGTNVIGLKPDSLGTTFNDGTFEGLLTANGIDANYTWTLPKASGVVALITDIPTSTIERGVFGGEFALSNAVRGGEYTPLSQSGALTLSAGAGAVNGGIDTVLLTADGNSITVPGAWKKLSSDSISTTAATVMFIMVRRYQGVIYYTVNIVT